MSHRPFTTFSRPYSNLNRETVPDRRAEERIPVRDFCEMVMSGHNMSRICMVHNLTAHGAMIECSVIDVPETFILLDPARNIRATCRVVWQKGTFVGVEFQKSIKL